MEFTGSPFLIDPENIRRVEKFFATRNSHVGTELYVGNLAYSVTHNDLEEWFTRYGTVQSTQLIHDRDDMGRINRFGFVEMDTDAQAQAAIRGLNDQELDGLRITVDESKPWEARRGGFVGGSIDGRRRG